MRRLITSAIVLLMVVMVPRFASAQAKEGDNELLFNGSVSTFMQSGSKFTFGQGVVNIGHYMSDALQVGGGPSLFVSSGGFGSGTTVQVGANGFLRKYFNASRPTMAPFVGVEGYAQDFKDFSNTLFVNGIAGVKNYLNERSAIEFSAGFGVNPSHPADLRILQFKVGLTVLIGG
jgi:hypothetical protein